ncbi:MAG: carotenoid biosynthesis protein [Cellulophaga sp.]|nr:carotenoid biosynthesis protein [Cellulophaga sp.]
MFQRNKSIIAIITIWVFHIAAIIGVSLGYQDWFIPKTPLNLTISLLLFLWAFPINDIKKFTAFSIFFVGGFFAEWLGVNYGILFGDYAYGNNFGIKIGGVPLLIGAYWALLTFVTGEIIAHFTKSGWLQVIGGATLMVLLDYFMEHLAPIFDFWTFAGNIAPLENYVTWFAIALLFQLILFLFKIKGDTKLSFHYYGIQLLFFVFFYFTLT